jgi:hypothetical protein
VNDPIAPSKPGPTEIWAFCIYILMWLVAAFELANMQNLGLGHSDTISYLPVLLFICSIFYIIYLAVHSFWRTESKAFYRWLLAIAVLPLIVTITIVIVEVN